MSIRVKFVVVALVSAVAVAAVAVPTVGAAAPVKLLATVGPDETITLTTATGKPVRTLKAGLYIVAVNDLSEEHNFVLRGAGVSKATSVVGTGTSNWRVKVVRGKTYVFSCAPHAAMMRGSFRGR